MWFLHFARTTWSLFQLDVVALVINAGGSEPSSELVHMLVAIRGFSSTSAAGGCNQELAPGPGQGSLRRF